MTTSGSHSSAEGSGNSSNSNSGFDASGQLDLDLPLSQLLQNSGDHHPHLLQRHGSYPVNSGAARDSSYPLAAYLCFCPGGITYAHPDKSHLHSLSEHYVSSSDASYPGDGSGAGGSSSGGSGKKSPQGTISPPSMSMNNSVGRRSSSPLSPTSVRSSRSRSPLSSSWSSSSSRYQQQQQDQQSPQHSDMMAYAARQADDRLRQYSLLSAAAAGVSDPLRTVPFFLPSLAALAEAAFGRLTGVAACSGTSGGKATATVKEWADCMVLQYMDDKQETVPSSEEDIYNSKPQAVKMIRETTAQVLKKLLEQAEKKQQQGAEGGGIGGTCVLVNRPRPCGYVFKRGDIAWNCRTCQTDNTCVICDECFRNSDHEGHEVYFHRTTPGGCCDCGDAEAWKLGGCCERHRPLQTASVENNTDDPMEAVRSAAKGLQEGKDTINTFPTALPKRLAAALGVVIGAAVECLVQAVDGAGIGADPIQWKMRWADEAAKIVNGAVHNEEFCFLEPSTSPASFMGTGSQTFPDSYRLHLRLHNDDVHTFDEVIEALHEPRPPRRSSPSSAGDDSDSGQNPSLVTIRDNASDMTHHVDSDGQVEVKSYGNVPAAMQGFRRLKSRGLHCAVVSTAQADLEHRARGLALWLSEISAAHPAVHALVVHALVQVSADHDFSGIQVWRQARMIPPWAAMDETDEIQACRRRFHAFPPHLASSYLTREESELLHGIALTVDANRFVELTGTVPAFYSKVPYRLPSARYFKSPHALWGTLPSLYSDPAPPTSKHPLLYRLAASSLGPNAELSTTQIATMKNKLTESVFVVDTDLRKQQEADRITSSVYPHRLPGLNMISGIGTLRLKDLSARRPPLPSPMDLRHLLATSSFRVPISPIVIMLLLDPYPTKQVRGAIHALFLSLLTDSRFKSRFAGAIGIAYRPLSTLFCAGVGTEADTPIHFTVQIFTAGSLVRALGSAPATEKLLSCDKEIDGNEEQQQKREASIGVFSSPISHVIVRCIHTNLLGATKEVNMILKNATSGNDDDSEGDAIVSNPLGNDNLLAALTYVAGEHPLMTTLPAAPDDCFLDSRSTRHKRLPHLLRDLEYIIETPGTAIRLLLPQRFPIYQGPSLSFRGEDILAFPSVFSRMLRLAQGMDPQKRIISGGHVEYEQNRWLEAFGLSLNFAGTRDALAESPASSIAALVPISEDGSHLTSIRQAMGNVFASLLREIKLWLYREGMLETGLPVPSAGANGTMDPAQVEALQRSTLHVSGSPFSTTPLSAASSDSAAAGAITVALSCATGVKMTETQLSLIENALKIEAEQRRNPSSMQGVTSSVASQHSPASGPVMGDWLRVPHAPLAGDSLSFHLPLHRALAKCVRSICSVVVPESIRTANPKAWWKIPVLDDQQNITTNSDLALSLLNHPLVPVIRSTLRSSNCRVVWMAGPDCSPQEAQRRRVRSRAVSANIAVAKIIHSLADHPMRCLAASQQIDRHLWARNGSSIAMMATNYSGTPLCRSFRDHDLLLVQLSAAGMNIGLGARRVFSLLTSRFSLDGYLCDPERRANSGNVWVNPPRLQDPDHAIILSESFFSTLCVLVTELPPPPPTSSNDDSSLRQGIRRELLHALAALPRSYSEAMTAASCGVTQREESEGISGTNGGGGLFRETFADVLQAVGKQKSQGADRRPSGPAVFELNPECCEEYDPTFFHLRRQEHQHAMDVVSRLRKQKTGSSSKDALDTTCLPLVCAPPKAHPRFLSCRLLLHLPSMDAAIRRSLLFAFTGGSWLPPAEPAPKLDSMSEDGSTDQSTDILGVSSSSTGDIPVSTFSRRRLQSQGSGSFLKRSSSEGDGEPFSQEVVAASSVSFLEILHLLTLQVHTLEECASLHRTLPDLDDEARSLSSGLSINSYLGRLVRVPESLIDVWAFRPYPSGPLRSSGSGENRGSILGFLIALYEHRSDHRDLLDSDGAEADDGPGGARALASSGLKWLLRFVNALVDGAPSVGVAIKSATTGNPIHQTTSNSPASTAPGAFTWTIDEKVRSTISGMLVDLPDLWPKEREREKKAETESKEAKSKEARKAAQMRVMQMMKRKQAAFAATISPSDDPAGSKVKEIDSESDLCIICRCDDTDGENNGPLGYLGHVQRSRVAQMRSVVESANEESPKLLLLQTYRVIGHMGCQLRETEAMDSKPLHCLPKGSVVSVLKSKVSPKYGILSRRVLVRHVSENPDTKVEVVTEGWASIQSSQGYVILSPLNSLCYNNSRWGSTRPIIKQCGHAAHLKCVERHTLSLHQRAAGEQPYDGRFAANISDGEFLCPLCKQLSNILIPRDNFSGASQSGCLKVGDDDVDGAMELDENPGDVAICGGSRGSVRSLRALLTAARLTTPKNDDLGDMGRKALEDFGSHLHNGMTVPWERTSTSRRRKQQQWHPAIRKWDYEEDPDLIASSNPSFGVGSTMRFLRQQLIAWAAVGHSAAASEASARGVEEVLPFGVLSQTSDPWTDYENSRDGHPMLLELKRTLTGVSGLFEVLCLRMASQLAKREGTTGDASVIGTCIADIVEGKSWFLAVSPPNTTDSASSLSLWSELTALTSSMPCHVSSDGVIQQSSEARAAAAQMWAVRGLASSERSTGEPPAPLSIAQIFSSNPTGVPAIPRGWGTMDPFVVRDADERATSQSGPFRPGIASAFLYTPLLAWDMYTLAGGLFSSVLANEVRDLPTSEELLYLARLLLVGRIIQAIITPGGFEMPDEMELDEEGCWSEAEIQNEGPALAKLMAHCRTMVQMKLLKVPEGLIGNEKSVSSSSLLAGVGGAILPFSRVLILLLRATSAVIKERQEKSRMPSLKASSSDKCLNSLIYKSKHMEVEDGFHILKALQGPHPCSLINTSKEWWVLINRWLVGVIGLELHHGSMGRSILPTISPSIAGQKPSTVNHVISSLTTWSRPPAVDTGDTQMEDVEAKIDRPDRANHFEEYLGISHSEDLSAIVDQELDDSDEDIEDSMDEAEEMVDFAEQMIGAAFNNAGQNGRGSDDAGESSEGDSSALSEANGATGGSGSDREFSYVSRSPILSYQPSLLAIESVGLGKRETTFEFAAASAVMADLSHMGLVHRKDTPTFSLIGLPKSFVELYNIVNKVKGRDDSALGDEGEDVSSAETAICLLSGAVMRSGSSRRAYSRAARPPGACTHHARKNGSGIGIFFLVQKCTVLLMHNNKSAYSPSLYVDEHGEEDPGLRRGRPLFLNGARFRALELLWRRQGIPGEVAQIRSTSDRVIRDNWY